MGFSSFLQGFLPRRWLDPTLPGNQKLFNGLGSTLDWINSLLQQVKNEARIMTAVDTIPVREREFGITSDPSLAIEVRRSGIIARKREQSGPITIDSLSNSLQAYGIVVDIQNDYLNSIMHIRILNVNGVPAGYEQVQEFIREVVRAHVDVQFLFRYLMISEVEALTIAQLEATTLDKLAWG